MTEERERFVEWHLAHYPNEPLARRGDGYRRASVNHRWEGWQARAVRGDKP
jgi:hypothetical protein